MNYITQIKGFWRLHERHAFSVTDISLYFSLLEICNSANWINPFKRNNAKIMADLHISRNTFFRSRRKLQDCGILNFRSMKGASNVTYKLTDLEAMYRDRNKTVSESDGTAGGTGCGLAFEPSFDALNKNSKLKLKQAVAVSYAEAFQFFAVTGNCRLLKEKFRLDDAAVAVFFKIFYDSKIDLGDLNNKTLAETARNFYYWLPKHLDAGQREKEKSCAKKEIYQRTGNDKPVRGVAAAMKFAGVKMRGEE